MVIVMSHPVAYTKNIHLGTPNSEVLYSGVYGPDGVRDLQGMDHSVFDSCIVFC